MVLIRVSGEGNLLLLLFDDQLSTSSGFLKLALPQGLQFLSHGAHPDTYLLLSGLELVHLHLLPLDSAEPEEPTIPILESGKIREEGVGVVDVCLDFGGFLGLGPLVVVRFGEVLMVRLDDMEYL